MRILWQLAETQGNSLVFKCLPFGLTGRGLLILILPDVSPAITGLRAITKEPVQRRFKPQRQAKRQAEEELVDNGL